MKLDFSQVIRNLNGKPLVEEGKDVLLSSVACNALLLGYEDERGLPGEEKVKRLLLAERIYEGKVQELSIEEAALIKKLIAKAYTSLIVGRAWTLIDKSSEGITK